MFYKEEFQVLDSKHKPSMANRTKEMKTKRRGFNGMRVLAILVVLAVPTYGVKSGAQEIASSDVFTHVALARGDIDLIRLEMGKPKLERPDIQVNFVEPREVFFQALTLFRKTNQLCFELTGKRASMPPHPSEAIQPRHVLDVVNKTMERIRLIKDELGIAEKNAKPERDPGKTSTDVFRSIVQANRQINIMLARQIAPSDVYQRLTEAISYAAFLLREFPEVKDEIPPAPPFERRKTPADVYRRLVECVRIIQQTVQLSGLSILRASLEEEANVVPGDVYNIASLIVSELAYLNKVIGNRQPVQSFYPGRKFPSQVYQQAGILKNQLWELMKQVDKNRGWLKK